MFELLLLMAFEYEACTHKQNEKVFSEPLCSGGMLRVAPLTQLPAQCASVMSIYIQQLTLEPGLRVITLPMRHVIKTVASYMTYALCLRVCGKLGTLLHTVMFGGCGVV